MFFLPYKVSRSYRLPLFTIGLIVANVFFFALSVPFVPEVWTALGFRFNVHGLYTWLTSMFLHGDPVHLLGNMYFLWLFGGPVEDAIGRVRYAVLYFAGGIAAILLHSAVSAVYMPGMLGLPLIGASGGLAAVIGVFAVRMYKYKVSIFWFILLLFLPRWGVFRLTSLVAVGLWLLREVGYGVMAATMGGSPVANWAHVGGAVFGGLAALVFGLASEADLEHLAREAESHAAAGASAVATGAYSKLVAAEPDNPQWYLDRAVARATGVTETAMADGNRATWAANDFAKGIDLLLRAGRNAEIVPAYERVAGLLGDELPPRTLLAVGSASEATKRFDLAGQAYWTLLQAHPGAREAERAHFRLAHVYLAADMHTEAADTWRHFSATYPMSEWARHAHQWFSAEGAAASAG